ncbi:hypothetical protein F5Y16DRAFT_364960 [Xylariaceae sp. FL0255]|nr:hypothetical protein F5Y16DRAFT_364960 [Xylariaceae sp. FL0255]
MPLPTQLRHPQTRDIPESEWNGLKHEIIRLCRENTLKKLVEVMMTQHGFEATEAQYEFRLKKWKIRSNLTIPEWQVILSIKDDLEEQNKAARIHLSGMELDQRRIRKGRAQCNSSGHRSLRKRSNYGFLEQVVISVQRSPSVWTPLESCDGPAYEKFRTACANSNKGPESGVRPRSIVAANQVDLRHNIDRTNMSLNTLVEGPDSASQPLCPSTSHQALVPYPGHASQVSHSYSETELVLSNTLPDQLLLFGSHPLLQNRGEVRRSDQNVPSPKPSWIVDPHSFDHISSHRSMSLNSSVVGYDLSMDKPWNFCLTGGPQQQKIAQPFIQQDNRNTEVMFLGDALLKTLTETILTSGVAGLNEIPLINIIRYLHKPGSLNSIFRRLYGFSQHVCKSLIIKLFWAAIEAEDCRALKCLLENEFIAARDMVALKYVRFDHNRERYDEATALHRAMVFENPQLLSILVQAGAFCSPLSLEDFLIERLHGYNNEAICSPENSAQIAQLLLRAGALATAKCVSLALVEARYTTLVHTLVDHLTPATSVDLLSSNTLRLAILNSDETLAIELASKFLHAVQQHDGTFEENPKGETEVLIEAAHAEYFQFIEVFGTPKATEHLTIHWGQVLSVAIRKRNPKLVRMVLLMNPNLNEPPHLIDFKYYQLDRVKTTSYAEAVRARNDEIVILIEQSHDFYSQLMTNNAAQYALDAAASVGNITIMRRLLSKLSVEWHVDTLDLSATMTRAILDGNTDIFWLLINQGVDLHLACWDRPDPFTPNPFSASLLQQNSEVFFGLMAAGPVYAYDCLYSDSFSRYCGDYSYLLDLAILWKDKKVLAALGDIVVSPGDQETEGFCYLFPDPVIAILRENREEILDFLVLERILTRESLTDLFFLAIPLGDADFLGRLIACGADPFQHPNSILHKVDRLFDKGSGPGSVLGRNKHIFDSMLLKVKWILLDLAKGTPHMSSWAELILITALKSGEHGLTHVTDLLESDLVSRQVDRVDRVDRSCINSENFLEMDDWYILNHADQHVGVFRKLAETGWFRSLSTRFLHQALHIGNYELAKLCIGHEANVEGDITLGPDRRLLSPLHRAVREESVELIMLLLGNGADIRRYGKGGICSLAIAIETGNLHIVKLLLAYGADINRSRDGGMTLLAKATRATNLEITRLLIEHGATIKGPAIHVPDPLSPYFGSITLLQTAIIAGSLEILKLLVAKGLDVNETQFNGNRTALQRAVECNKLDMVNFLIAEGADVNAKASYGAGATAFQLAAINGNCLIASCLLENDADMHAPPAKVHGRLPLEGAAEQGQILMIDFLHQNGYHFEEAECKRAIKFAEENHHPICVERIQEIMQSNIHLDGQIEIEMTKIGALESAKTMFNGLDFT